MNHYKQLCSILAIGLLVLTTSGSLIAGGASADLSITKDDGVTTATPGGQITYTITASNAGPDDVTGATVADTFPAELINCSTTCVSTAPNSCTAGPVLGDLNDALVDLVSGGSVVYTAVCDIDVTATGTLSNTATISSATTDPDTTNNSATDGDTSLVLMADISVTKTDGITSATPGDMLTYTIVASNAGPDDDPNVSLTDTLPADLSCTFTSVAAGGATGNTAAGAGDLAETLSMPSGSSVTYTLTCAIDVTATGTLSNTATVTGSLTDPDTTNNSATDDTALNDLVADLSVTKTADSIGPVIPGGTIAYTIVAQNNGPNIDPAAVLTDILPAELTCTYTSVAAGGATGNTVAGAGDINDVLSLPNGSNVTYTLDCNIDVGFAGSLSNTATLASSVTDPTAANDSATDTTSVFPAVEVPTITQWGLILLAVLIGMMTLIHHRREAKNT